MRMLTNGMEKKNGENRRKIFNVYLFCRFIRPNVIALCTLFMAAIRSRPNQSRAKHKLIFYCFMFEMLVLHHIRFPFRSFSYALNLLALYPWRWPNWRRNIIFLVMIIIIVHFIQNVSECIRAFRIPDYPSENWHVRYLHKTWEYWIFC